jgi:hypothetical protein
VRLPAETDNACVCRRNAKPQAQYRIDHLRRSWLARIRSAWFVLTLPKHTHEPTLSSRGTEGSIIPAREAEQKAKSLGGVSMSWPLKADR